MEFVMRSNEFELLKFDIKNEKYESLLDYHEMLVKTDRRLSDDERSILFSYIKDKRVDFERKRRAEELKDKTKQLKAELDLISLGAVLQGAALANRITRRYF